MPGLEALWPGRFSGSIKLQLLTVCLSGSFPGEGWALGGTHGRGAVPIALAGGAIGPKGSEQEEGPHRTLPVHHHLCSPEEPP